MVIDARSFFPQLGLLAPPISVNAKLPEVYWFDQKLDHFGDGQGSWKQRYFVNDTFWSKENGPVFLMLGGESKASPYFLCEDTDVMKNARKYNAMVILIEHRYRHE